MSCWQKMFERREDVVIDNLESIRDSDLDMYSVLKPQGIESLIVVPLVLNDVISGFIWRAMTRKPIGMITPCCILWPISSRMSNGSVICRASSSG